MKDVTPKDWSYFAPENTVIYAIGDLHGHLDAHDKLYVRLEAEASKTPEKQHIIIYLGDYIDRGPQSAELLERLIRLEDGNITHHFLVGNHETGLLGYLEDPHGFANWLEYGGIETSQSYGCQINKRAVMPAEREGLQDELRQRIPATHLKFLNSLDHMKVMGDYCFVHAGIRPEVPLGHQKPQDLRFIREPFLSWPDPHEKCVVHGHTITEEPEILSNRLGLDTGLYRTGILTCAILENNNINILQINNRN